MSYNSFILFRQCVLRYEAEEVTKRMIIWLPEKQRGKTIKEGDSIIIYTTHLKCDVEWVGERGVTLNFLKEEGHRYCLDYLFN